MKFRISLFILFSILVFSCNQPGKKEKKPNIIFILADDYGYMDSQAYAEHVLGTDKSEMFL